MSVTVMRVDPDNPDFDQLVQLFDAYRTHYGEPPSPARTATWLADNLRTGRLRASMAVLGHGTAPDRPVAGFVTSAVSPASLRLSTFWMVRDLFVSPDHRRAGAARALLDHVVTQARAAGALRVSLQTEPDNAAALALYAEAGFRPVQGLTTLALPLAGQP
jgi:ribosomal protein S18 acetylase RimI-like enzyme